MESKTVLDYKSHSMDSIFQSFSVELGFWIPFLSGIPDSLSCILGSKAQDSGFNEQNFPGFRILQAKISHIPKFGSPYLGRYLYLLFIFLSRCYFLYFSQFGGGFHRLNFALACRSTLTLPRKPNYDSYVFTKRTNLYFYSLNYSITLNLEIFYRIYYNCQCNPGFLVTDLRQKMRI